MPEGTTLELINAVVQDFENFLTTVPEITSMVSYTGDASPMDFNGMSGTIICAKQIIMDIGPTSRAKDARDQQSHAIAEFYAREMTWRPSLQKMSPKSSLWCPARLSGVANPQGELYADVM